MGGTMSMWRGSLWTSISVLTAQRVPHAIDQEASDGIGGVMEQPADEDGIPIEGQYHIALDTTGAPEGATLDRT